MKKTQLVLMRQPNGGAGGMDMDTRMAVSHGRGGTTHCHSWGVMVAWMGAGGFYYPDTEKKCEGRWVCGKQEMGRVRASQRCGRDENQLVDFFGSKV